MKNHLTKVLTLSLALMLLVAPASSFAKNDGNKVRSENKVKVEIMETDHGFYKNFWLPFGIWKKITHHATSSTATTTASTTPHRAKVSIITNIRTFFKSLASGTYNLSITATDQNGNATSTVLGSIFTK